MRRLWGALALVALCGCDPELNDPECAVTAECSFRPGTVCSPEGWCVAPEAVRVDMAVRPMPDMRRPDPDVGGADVTVDLAVVDAAVDAMGGDDLGAVDGGVDFAVDGGAGDGAVGDPDLDPADAGDVGFVDAESGDLGADDMAAEDAVAGDAGDVGFSADAVAPPP